MIRIPPLGVISNFPVKRGVMAISPLFTLTEKGVEHRYNGGYFKSFAGYDTKGDNTDGKH